MINQEVQLAIINNIINRPDYLGKYADDNVMNFLQRIWSLRTMPSEDSRYDNAYDDVYKHIVLNSDWDNEYLYLTRLKLIVSQNDDLFKKFVEKIVHPETRIDSGDIRNYVDVINGFLIESDERLALVDYFEGSPVFQFRIGVGTIDLPIEIAANEIPFFKSTPNTFPCFVLTQSSWDDYGNRTSMQLKYHESDDRVILIGPLKIMERNTRETWNVLPENFFLLTNEFCSLGQSRPYYERLKEKFPSNYQSILLALRDTAMFPRIAESFEAHGGFRNSLKRENTAEKLLRTIRFELQDGSLMDYFKFTYSFKPPFSETPTNFFFDFKYDVDIESRIIALIGKNGTGKTSLLSSLIQAFSRQNSNSNLDKMPLFGKYFTVSYSVFDRYIVPEANAAFNYVYCGLRNGNELKNEEELHREFFSCVEKIKTRDLYYQWHKILANFLSDEHLNLMFPKRAEELPYGMVTFDEAKYTLIRSQFSSGESILLFIITKIISEIRHDSLILYDEPETHLHPNAITSLMNSLFELVTMFKSFCVIATHSPLIVRELRSSQVKILKRENNELDVYTLEKDSFGENLTVITDEIFGNRDVSKHYKTVLRTLVLAGKTYEEIISLIEEEGLPISLNASLFLNTLIEETDVES